MNKIQAPYHGAAYYPELWPKETLEEDIRLFQEMGFNLARIGEFAWGVMEPREGEYDFSYFAGVVKRLYEAGIATVLCTPSATPPQWLTDKYEETRVMSPMGVRAQHGARRHACPNSPVMRRFNKELVGRMAAALARLPGVLGWQIDNEIHPEGNCFCPVCRAAFARWLAGRFATVDELNKSWGMARWSLSYTSFEAVPAPRPDTWNHPSLLAAYAQFMEESYTDFAREQAETLRENGAENLGTDLAPRLGVDFYEINRPMDVAMINHYDDAHSLPAMPAWFDYVRPLKKRPFYSTETLPDYNGNTAATPYRPEGFCYVNGWMAYLCGGEMNLYWHFRRHPNGHELMHGAVVSPAGRLCLTANELKRISRELPLCWEFLGNTRVVADAAVHLAATSVRQFAAAPYAWDFHYQPAFLSQFYLPLTQKARLTLDLIDTPQDISPYRLLFSPYLRSMDEHNLQTRITRWVKEGGTWVVGPVSDVNNRNLSLYTHAPYGFLEEFAGIKSPVQVPKMAAIFPAAFVGGAPAPLCGPAADALEPIDAETLIAYTGGPLKGYAAATVAKRGKGRVVMLGAAPEGDALAALLSGLGYKKPCPGTENIAVYRREGEGLRGFAAAELAGREGSLTLQGKHKDFITGDCVEGTVSFAPYQVRVLQEV